MTHTLICHTATVALVALAFGPSSALAQTSSDGSSGSQSTQPSESSSNSGQSTSGNTVVATVGDVDITGQDLSDFIASLPPQMRQQPPQMIASMALDQVILRELVLQEAEAQNLSEDPRVAEIVGQNAQLAQEDAMVAVFLQDQLAERVTDEEVQQAYNQLQAQAGEGQSLPPLDQVRAQVEQQLQRQELPALRDELAQDAEIVVYGAGETSSSAGNGPSGSNDGSQGSASQSQ